MQGANRPALIQWIDDLWIDMRHAARAFQRNPGFAGVAMLMLGLGIGGATVMFSILYGVLFKPLAYAEPDRLLALQERTDVATAFGNLWAFAYPNFLDLNRETKTLDVAAWRNIGGTLSSPGSADYVTSLEVSHDLFSILGVSPALGQTFRPEDDAPGGAPVAIISNSTWESRFGRSPSAIGSTLTFNGRPYTVTGVLPAGFRMDDVDIALYTLIGQSAQPALQNRQAHPGIQVWARMRPGASQEGATAEIDTIAQRLENEYPESNEGRSFVAQSLTPRTGNTGATIWLLFGAVALVLLIACANMASLLVARSVSRTQEMAVRTSLGAQRGRLARQALAESALLGLGGGALGVGLAYAGVVPFMQYWPGNLPRIQEVQIDNAVLLFALLTSLACSLLFGLAPALRNSAIPLEQALRAGGRTVVRGSRRLHACFVAAELALAIALLVSTGVLGWSLLQLSSKPTGVDAENVLVARFALSPGILTDPSQIRASWRDVLDRARNVVGVEAAALVDTVPMRAGNNQLHFRTERMGQVNENRLPLTLATSVTAQYFETLGIPLRAGRAFDSRDRLDSRPVVIIDDVLARQAFGDESPVGRQISVLEMGPDPLEVVGVVGHVNHWGLAEDDSATVRAQLYYPFEQVPDVLLRRFSGLMSIAVRTTGTPGPLLPALRDALRGSANDQVLYEIRTMDQLAINSLARHRFLMLLFTVFASVALLLSSIGVYGVIAYLTRQRLPEYGLRMALGAHSTHVIRLVLRQAAPMIFAGIGVGSLLALAAGRLIGRWIPGVQPDAPLPYVTMIAVMTATALLASLLPARKATHVDPSKVFRME
ncbi:MAG TPA: ABC transporter permease [Terriglobia bacterium]|nr:ABC transporter permease [Terriglobia bacterium]